MWVRFRLSAGSHSVHVFPRVEGNIRLHTILVQAFQQLKPVRLNDVYQQLLFVDRAILNRLPYRLLLTVIDFPSRFCLKGYLKYQLPTPPLPATQVISVSPNGIGGSIIMNN